MDDINEWLADKSHILSFSLEESFHYAIGNGMAAGLKPAIHAWRESRNIWPEQYIFRNLEEFLAMAADDSFEPQIYRQKLFDHGLDADRQIAEIEQVIGECIALPRTVGSSDSIRNSDEIFRNLPTASVNGNKYPEGSDIAKRIAEQTNEWIGFQPYDAGEMREMLPKLLNEGEIISIKTEAIDRGYRFWEMDFCVRHNGRGMTPMFFLFDSHTGQINAPYECLSEKYTADGIDKLRDAIHQSIHRPNVKLSENLRGYVYDRRLLESIQSNSRMYIWERSFPGTVFAPLRGFKTIMTRYLHAISRLPKNATIVDAASGLGYGAKFCSSKCKHIYAVDISEEILATGITYYDSPKITWTCADATDLPLSANSVDGFISMETLEHIQDPRLLLKEINRVVRPGGTVLVSTPNGRSSRRQAINNPFHIKEYAYEEVMGMFSEVFGGCRVLGLDSTNTLHEVNSDNIAALDNFLIEARPSSKRQTVHHDCSRHPDQATPEPQSSSPSGSSSADLSLPANSPSGGTNSTTSDSSLTKYNTSNPLKLQLHPQERVRDYMDLFYVLTHTIYEKIKTPLHDLIDYLQFYFHKALTPYFNTIKIPIHTKRTILTILSLLHHQHSLDTNPQLSSDAELIKHVYEVLNEIMPPGQGQDDIAIPALPQRTADLERDPIVESVYKALSDHFDEMRCGEMLDLFVIHGSFSTMDYTLFSDIDTQLFLTDKVFSSVDIITSTAQFISRQQSLLLQFDPLQHHGFFISTDMDRKSYPQSFLPVETLKNSTSIFEPVNFSLRIRTLKYADRFAAWHMGYFFRIACLNRYHPTSPFDQKRYLSRLAMLPLLKLELIRNTYPYKGEVFKRWESYFHEQKPEFVQTLSEVRRHWDPQQLIRLPEVFYREVHEYAEELLTDLRTESL
ncbi:MAG: class I SAM-dependent methyltransferase [Bacteroidota bacterium]